MVPKYKLPKNYKLNSWFIRNCKTKIKVNTDIHTYIYIYIYIYIHIKIYIYMFIYIYKWTLSIYVMQFIKISENLAYKLSYQLTTISGLIAIK